MTTRPRLELLVAPGTGERVVPLLHAVARWWEPTAPDPSLAPPLAVLATSSRAPGLSERLGSRVPVAVWADPTDPAAGELTPPPHVVLVPVRHPDDAPHLDAAEGSTLITVPVAGLHAGAHRPVSPFVRSRWRRALGLPEHMVLSVDLPGSPHLGDDALATGLAVASAVAASGPVVLRAMALGAPVATDSATAAAFGLRAVVVAGEIDGVVAAAAELAGDPVTAARLSLEARREVEERHDIGRAAAAWRDAVAGPDPDPRRRARRLAAELGSHPLSVPARRVEAALAGLAEG